MVITTIIAHSTIFLAFAMLYMNLTPLQSRNANIHNATILPKSIFLPKGKHSSLPYDFPRSQSA